MTLFAGLVALELDGLGHAASRLDQVEREIGPHIGAFGGLAISPAAAKHFAKRAIAEDIAKRLENIGHIAKMGAAATGTVDAGMSVAVVASPLFLVAQNLEGLGGFLEASDRFFIARIAVRMEFERELTVCVGDGFVGGGAFDRQHLVVTAFGGHWRHGGFGRESKCVLEL